MNCATETEGHNGESTQTQTERKKPPLFVNGQGKTESVLESCGEDLRQGKKLEQLRTAFTQKREPNSLVKGHACISEEIMELTKSSQTDSKLM